jgi:hypothetical protein
MMARSKYGAKRTLLHGISFHSKWEAQRYQQLLLIGLSGALRNLELQPSFDLHVNGVRIGRYVGDFRYQELVNGKWYDITEDAKGWVTLPLSRWKQVHLAAEYGITVREVRRRPEKLMTMPQKRLSRS